MRTDEGGRFSRAMTRFLEQQCVIGAEYSIADEQLFAHFKAFWIQAPERFDHRALLGQFRVELMERGFHAEPGGKWPHWLGLTTREQDNQRHREEREKRRRKVVGCFFQVNEEKEGVEVISDKGMVLSSSPSFSHFFQRFSSRPAVRL